MRALTLALVASLQVSAAFAEGFAFPNLETLVGNSRLLTNDLIGDGKDRWRSGSYAVSFTFGDSVADGLPKSAGALMEYRLRAEILAPANLAVTTAFPDRPYAGVIGLGAFTHVQKDSFNLSYGGELVFVGPSTGLGNLQSWIHGGLGTTKPQMLGEQLPNRLYPTVQAEVSRDIFVGSNATLLRPFVEAQAGIETYARIGVDAILGNGFQRNFFTRDPTTGFPVTNVRRNRTQNVGFILGGDVAYVTHSNLLPTSRGYKVRDFRPRLRAGVMYEGKNTDVFYGATWLGREFQAQSGSQVVGSIRLNLRF